ncbi:MAG: response regulator [Acidimicrobiia bacterium]
MNWTSDPELQEMFFTELGERCARLLEGARAMQEEAVDGELAGAMLREGHTIKGTSRVMGFEMLSQAGRLIEELWRGIQHGDEEPSAGLGERLEAVAVAIPPAAKADPDEGTPELAGAIAALEGTGPAPTPPEPGPTEPSPPEAPQTPVTADAVSDHDADEATDTLPDPDGDTAPDSDPVPDSDPRDAAFQPESEPADPDGEEETVDQDEERPTSGEVIPLRPDVEVPGAVPSRPRFGAPPTDTAQLGGLIGALESWAAGQTMAVNAGRLYRLINAVSDIRNEVATVRSLLEEHHAASPTLQGVADAVAGLQHDALALAAIPLSGMTNSLPQLVRYLAKKLEKDVKFEIVGDDDLAVDRQVVDVISDPVRQIIVNAIRHGIEPPPTRAKVGKTTTGLLSVTTTVKDGMLEIVVTDDGAGVDWELVRSRAIELDLYEATEGVDVDKLRTVLFASGFSTVLPGDLGGEGDGLAAVAQAVEALFGRVKLETTAGVGTSVTVTVPTSRALQRVVVVEEDGRRWGLPEAVVDEVIPGAGAEIDWRSAAPALDWHGREVPVVPFGELVGAAAPGDPSYVVVVSHRLGEFAFTAESVTGVREVVVKELGPLLSGPSHISGAALLGAGEVVLVLDAGTLFDRLQLDVPEDATPARVLVVDDSIGARAVVSGALASSGFSTSVASSVADALEMLRTQGADAVVVDFSMPQEDGIALVDQVRARFSDLPVVMLSGVATPEDQDRAKRAGVDVFFEKADFREGALADTLRRMLDVKGETG